MFEELATYRKLANRQDPFGVMRSSSLRLEAKF
jgi:hypothetical protein